MQMFFGLVFDVGVELRFTCSSGQSLFSDLLNHRIQGRSGNLPKNLRLRSVTSSSLEIYRLTRSGTFVATFLPFR